MTNRRRPALVLTACVLLWGCSGDEAEGPAASAATSRYVGDYALDDAEFGTRVTVAVSEGVRTIRANALPNHETGQFPNAGNPNTIAEQSVEWVFPVEPGPVGTAREARVPGVSINGVKFEPGTAETTTCATGEMYRVEALQNTYDLGFDTNNAHVQPNGEYHYHGVSPLMVAAFDGTSGDLVHVGFATDGHLIMYAKSGAYPPSYRLSTAARTGTDCVPSLRGAATVDLEGTMPDGTYTSDWVFDDSLGVLDECNGVEIDGTYVYVITEGYPFVSRCLKSSFVEAAPAGPPPR